MFFVLTSCRVLGILVLTIVTFFSHLYDPKCDRYNVVNLNMYSQLSDTFSRCQDFDGSVHRACMLSELGQCTPHGCCNDYICALFNWLTLSYSTTGFALTRRYAACAFSHNLNKRVLYTPHSVSKAVMQIQQLHKFGIYTRGCSTSQLRINTAKAIEQASYNGELGR